MKQIKILELTIEDVKNRVENLVTSTQRIVARVNDSDEARRNNFKEFSLSFCKTYTYFTEKCIDMDNKTFKTLYHKLMKTRDAMIDYAILKQKTDALKEFKNKGR